jgi:hypothetical protein
MGKHQVRLLRFALQYPGWHSMNDKDQQARRAMYSLERLGLFIVQRYPGTKAQPQFRTIGMVG